MEIKNSHVWLAVAATAVICVGAWTLAYIMVERGHKNQAPQQAPTQMADKDWRPSPEDANKLLSEIAVPDEVEPANAVRPVQPVRDWPEIKASGRLRVALLPRQGPEGISGSLMPEDFERALLSGFARTHGLGVERVVVQHFDDLKTALLTGRCDVIAASYAITPERQKVFAFSKPFRHTVEQIVVPLKSATTLEALRGKTGVIQPGTSYWESMKALAAKVPQLKFEAAPEGLEPEALLARVASGRYAYTVAENSYVNAYEERRRDIKAVYSFPEGRDIAWPVNKASPALLGVLNAYIDEELPNKAANAGDLPEIKKRGFLRVITRNNPYCYFIHRGRAMGFEYELVSEFAKSQGLVPVMIVPPEWDDMQDWLADGKGDIIAANYTPTPTRRIDKRVSFAGSYGSTQQLLAGRLDEDCFRSISDLKGRTVAVRRSSSYWTTLDTIGKSGIPFNLVAVPEDLETSGILAKVASGDYDLTVADEPILNAEISAGRKVKPLLALSKPESYAWATSASTPQLHKAVENFLRNQYRPPSYRSAFFNITYKKYYLTPSNIAAADSELARGPSLTISPYDNLFRRYATRYGFNWCLIAAQSFQESQFNPDASSYLGTLGLLQLLPSTAADLGFKNLRDPETGIHAGVRYLRMQLERVYSDKLDEQNMICFALACYNAGYGHVSDARILAEDMGLNPNIWFGNVEVAMKQLSNPKVAARAKYGYCKSDETIGYVRDIIARFKHYSEMLEAKAP